MRDKALPNRTRNTTVACLLLLTMIGTRGAAVSPSDMPPSLRALPIESLLNLFAVPFETPNIAAEVARQHVWVPPVDNEVDLCPAYAEVIRRYPRTSDARRCLLDIATVYAKQGDWPTAEAPFRYVMEIAKGRAEAKIAHLRLLELYRYTGAPDGVDVIGECEAA